MEALEKTIISYGKSQRINDKSYYLYSLQPVELDIEFWAANKERKPHLFFVVSHLNCSICLDKFMKEAIEFNKESGVERMSILLIDCTIEDLYRYKRVYNVKIPMFITDEKKLVEIMKDLNSPYVFMADKNLQIMHFYSERNTLSLKQYLEYIRKRYFV